MDRPLIEVGELPCAEDFLGLAKETLYGLAYLAQATIGNNTGVNGFAIAPTGPASLSFTIGSGSIYALQTADATAYGVLGTDANTIFKQGILAAPVTLTVTPPATSGFSQVYLVQVAYSDVDGGASLVPFFNSLDPTHPSSSTQNTVRFGQAVIELKAGTAATSGAQLTPSPDVGFTALWAVTVANGATTITSANWVQQSAGPFSTPWFPSLESLTSSAPNSPGLENVVTFSTPGSFSYTPTAGARALIIEVQGAGGGGGATANIPGSGNLSVGISGGGGGYSKKYVLTSGLTFPATITVGAPGAGGVSSGNGTAGGTSSFVCAGMTSIVCTGGGGGINNGVSTAFPGGTTTAVGGAATGGDTNTSGACSQSALLLSSLQAIVGVAGASRFGVSPIQFGINSNGQAGNGPGAGGTGGLCYGLNSRTNGGAGAAGIIYITELF